MKVQSAVLAVATAFAVISGACSSGSGLTGSAGSSGTGTGGSCADVTACGGNVIGTWAVTSSCLKVTGLLDPISVGAHCPAPRVTGSLEVSGTWTANADGTLSDNTATTGLEQFSLDKSCLIISSTPTTCDGIGGLFKILGYDSVTCTNAAGGGCDCSAIVKQTGGLGVVSPEPMTSNYKTAGSTLTVTGNAGDTKYGYCAQGNTLTVTPQSTIPTVMGTIVLQKNGASGSAGTSGGTSGTSGTTGTAGQAGSTATTGNGGRGGSGGTSSTGTAGSPGTPGTAGTTGGGGTGGGAVGSMGPCDIYKAGGTPCVVAHSTVRALFGAYGGKLYQVRNSGSMTKDINAVSPGGVADAAAQDAFCGAGASCVITVIYDQTGNGLDVWYQGAGSPVMGVMQPASATKESIKVGGSKVYSLWMQGSSYWVDGSKKGVPLGKDPEGMYMVTSGGHSTGGCCFDYGNSETSRKVEGGGTMDALNFSQITLWQEGAGKGPWILADLEGGLYSSGDKSMKVNPNVPTMTNAFVTAVLRNNGTTELALRGGDATTGALTTYYKGVLPSGYSPMKKQGAVVLGSGGDCCLTNTNLAAGTFYEGAIVSGYPTDATEDAIQANIVAAKYSK